MQGSTNCNSTEERKRFVEPCNKKIWEESVPCSYGMLKILGEIIGNVLTSAIENHNPLSYKNKTVRLQVYWRERRS